MSDPTFIGRRDGLPVAALAGEGTARRCDHCGRVTADWEAREREDDRGPVQAVWCRDATACDTARHAAVRPSRLRLIRPGGPTP